MTKRLLGLALFAGLLLVASAASAEPKNRSAWAW
jgi:hypothetical protein